MIDQLKLRASGLVLLALLLPVALIGLPLLLVLILIGPVSWARNGLCALDLFGNATVFKGYPYETISSHTGRELLKGAPWAQVVSAFLDLFQKGHALGAYMAEAKLQNAIRAVNND